MTVTTERGEIMKQIISFLSMALLLTMLTSCSGSQLPEQGGTNIDDSTTDRNESYSDNTSAGSEEEGEVEKISLTNLESNKQQEIEKVMNFSCKNLKFVSQFTFDVPDEIGKYQIMCIDNFQDNWDKLAEKYIPADMYDDSKVTEDDRWYPYGPEFDDEETGRHVSVGCIGFFNYKEKIMSDILQDVVYGGDSIVSQNTYYLNGDYTNDVYRLKEENVSISEAVAMATDFVSDFIQVSGFPQELKPMVAVAYEDENENCVLHVRFCHLYNGLPICLMLDAHSDLELSELDFDLLGYPSATYYSDEKNSVGDFSVQCAFEDYETIETYETVITPESAVRLLSEKLSGYGQYDVIGMELVYCPVYNGESVDPNGMGKTHREAAPWAMACSYDIVELSPCWAIYMDVTPDREIYGLVDCVTGEVGFVNNQR